MIIVRLSKSRAFIDSKTCMLPTYYAHGHKQNTWICMNVLLSTPSQKQHLSIPVYKHFYESDGQDVRRTCCRRQNKSWFNMTYSLLYEGVANTNGNVHGASEHSIPWLTPCLSSCQWLSGWPGSLVVRVLDLQLDGRQFSSHPLRRVLWGVTVFGWANHRSIWPSHLGQLSLLVK